MKKVKYVWPNLAYDFIKVFGTSHDDPYNKKILIDTYEKHNRNVIEYFKNRPDDLLVINVGKKDDYTRFVEFLSIAATDNNFPWKNRT